MHKIDHPTATPQGLFTKGDPALKIYPTIITQDWLNAVQSELVNAIESGGLILDKSDNTQLSQLLTGVQSRFIPDLAILDHMGMFFRTGDATFNQFEGHFQKWKLFYQGTQTPQDETEWGRWLEAFKWIFRKSNFNKNKSVTIKPIRETTSLETVIHGQFTGHTVLNQQAHYLSVNALRQGWISKLRFHVDTYPTVISPLQVGVYQEDGLRLAHAHYKVNQAGYHDVKVEPFWLNRGQRYWITILNTENTGMSLSYGSNSPNVQINFYTPNTLTLPESLPVNGRTAMGFRFWILLY